MRRFWMIISVSTFLFVWTAHTSAQTLSYSSLYRECNTWHGTAANNSSTGYWDDISYYSGEDNLYEVADQTSDINSSYIELSNLHAECYFGSETGAWTYIDVTFQVSSNRNMTFGWWTLGTPSGEFWVYVVLRDLTTDTLIIADNSWTNTSIAPLAMIAGHDYQLQVEVHAYADHPYGSNGTIYFVGWPQSP